MRVAYERRKLSMRSGGYMKMPREFWRMSEVEDVSGGSTEDADYESLGERSKNRSGYRMEVDDYWPVHVVDEPVHSPAEKSPDRDSYVDFVSDKQRFSQIMRLPGLRFFQK
ncbi:hypothetical protein NDN08_005955 [Rhodosorus marinus]|uniref:Uncharacterized protein n=1 Tax=Rhodosorus marinus TaxID=101924 RepID=A0AAV8UJE3_9RHOD|nr:hypothetical protein NDN08_005955 [Rhodosorus marinus]